MARRSRSPIVTHLSGEEFRARRKAINMKGFEVAEALDVSTSYISRIERGKAPMTRVLEYALYGLECERDTHS